MKIAFYIMSLSLMFGVNDALAAKGTGLDIADGLGNSLVFLNKLCGKGTFNKTLRSYGGAYCMRDGYKGVGKDNLGGALANYLCIEKYLKRTGSKVLPDGKSLEQTDCFTKLDNQALGSARKVLQSFSADEACKFIGIFTPEILRYDVCK